MQSENISTSVPAESGSSSSATTQAGPATTTAAATATMAPPTPAEIAAWERQAEEIRAIWARQDEGLVHAHAEVLRQQAELREQVRRAELRSAYMALGLLRGNVQQEVDLEMEGRAEERRRGNE